MQVLTRTLTRVEEHLRGLTDYGRAERLQQLRQTLEQPELRVVIFGEFNRGKSTLINALLGRVVLPAKLVPTTGHVTRVVFGTTEEVRVQHLGGRRETCSLQHLDSFATLNEEGKAREDVEVIEVAVNSPLLRQGLVLIDTPGVSEREAQTRRARQAIAQADLVLLVLDARQLLSDSERDLVTDWLCRELNKPVAVMLNFLNLVEERERDDVRARVERWCRTHLGNEMGRGWFEVNVRGVLVHALGKGPSPVDDFVALHRALARCTGERRRELQHRSRRGQLLAEVRQVRAGNAQVLQRLRTDAARLEQERAARRHKLEELRRRFDIDAKVQRDRLGNFAEQALDQHLDRLVTVLFKGETRSILEEKAGGWYEGKLSEAIRSIEREADGAMLGLTGEALRRPEPLTIKERMILKARLDIESLPAVNASDQTIPWGMGIGAVVGTFVIPIPVLGAAAGAIVGGLLASWFGSSEPDYVAAYGAKARERWADDARDVRRALEGQYDARVEELRQQLDKRLRQAGARAGHATRAGTELEQRQALEATLDRCAQELRHA